MPPESGARARRQRRAERRLRHLRSLARAAAETTLDARLAGIETLGELEGESAFERAAREVLAAQERGELTASDVESLGLRMDADGGLWIRVGPAWGQG